MADLSTLVLIGLAVALFGGGLVKGLTGVGLPMLAIPLMAASIPLRDAIALMYGPVLITNLWQAFQGGFFQAALKRWWPMMACVVVGTWFGSKALVSMDPQVLESVVGATVAGFSLVNLLNPSFRIAERHALWLSLIIGVTGGFFGGLTLFVGPAVIMFLVSLHVPKEEFIGTIALIYLLGLIPTGIFYLIDGTLQQQHIIPTILSCIPVVVGMVLGTLIRSHINEILFRKILLIMLVLVGLNMIRKAVF